MTPLAPLVTAFFRKHLAAEKGVSKNTIASYSYTSACMSSETFWSIWNEIVATRQGPGIYA